jgi:hypothetical protein|tara:strand:- start:27739 stop:28713 length:975 start_codon:yes stop_codon:yes gene_type:complete
MTVNRIQIKRGDGDKKITIPISNDFDESLGREQLISLYERSEMQDNINITQDFETTRYKPITDNINNRIYYQMGFQLTPNNQPTGDIADYVPDYAAVGITHMDVNRRKSNYTKSFFKFDFYDTPNPQQQRLYFSIVNPANNGMNFADFECPGMPQNLGCLAAISNEPFLPNGDMNPNYDPTSFRSAQIKDLTQGGLGLGPYYYDKLEGSLFEFSAVGKKSENYYIQWLKDRELVKYNVFYMSCKFFNAETGGTHKFINKVQPAQKFDISAPDYFYYQIIFDPINFTYVFNEFDTTLYSANNGIGPQVGGAPGVTGINFYEYINP